MLRLSQCARPLSVSYWPPPREEYCHRGKSCCVISNRGTEGVWSAIFRAVPFLTMHVQEKGLHGDIGGVDERGVVIFVMMSCTVDGGLSLSRFGMFLCAVLGCLLL